MIPPIPLVRRLLLAVIADKRDQGHVVDGLEEELGRVDESYDQLLRFGRRLAELPLRDDWPYVEPNDLPSIWEECDPARPQDRLMGFGPEDSAQRVESAFLSRVSGCMLGKPFEIDVTLEEIRSALMPLGEWPIDYYISESGAHTLPRLQGQWKELVRERINHVAPDDDINYTILGMLLLEEHGADFTHDDLRRLWLFNLPVAATFGPERTLLLRSGIQTLDGDESEFSEWVSVLNPGDELCGALIRADPYAYAFIGHPSGAAGLAYRDASFTHRRTGIYASMFVAAAISVAPVVANPIDAFANALGFVPRRSRFHRAVADALTEVSEASDWLDGYGRVSARFGDYGFCRIFQEIGMLANTLRFAESIGDGICKQVGQGLDTDSFGATAGSLLGAFFGPGNLEHRWTDPFRDDIHTALAVFHERTLSRVAERMAALPERIARDFITER